MPPISDHNKAKIKFFASVAALGIFAVASYGYMTKLPKPGAVGVLVPSDYEVETRLASERLKDTVIWLCEGVGRRSSRYSVQEVQLRRGLDDALADAGFELITQDYRVGSRTFRNSVGIREGTEEGTILIGTHYDSYGKSVCANAAGTGVATLFETMRTLRDVDLKKTVIVGFFGTGEKPNAGRDEMGAKVWLDAAIEEGRTIDAAYLVGSFGCFRAGEGQNSAFPWYISYPKTTDWVGVYGSLRGKDFLGETLKNWGDVTELPARGISAPSWMLGIPVADQVPFQRAGIPAVLFTDTGEARDPYLRTNADNPYIIDYREMARRVEAFSAMVVKVATSSDGPGSGSDEVVAAK